MRLIELRKNKNLRQEDIAKILCMSQSTYQHYENGRAEPNIESLKTLADYYNVSIDYLVGRDHIGDIGYLDDDQRTAVKLIQNLNKNNLLHAISFMQGLYVNQ